MNEKLALTAAYGLDTQDLLNHIAWTDVLKPKLEEAKSFLTKQLVSVTLNAPVANSETREQIAGKLWGIEFMVTTIEKILKAGTGAREILARENLFLQ